MITPFPARDVLMSAAAQRIADALKAGVAARGSACAALSGGSTPEPAYALLAAMPLDWPRIAFALVDERCVPVAHDASNEKMLRRALAPALAAGAKLEPMMGASADPAANAAQADARHAPLHIDIALMGMGGDGHTASWFPGGDGLAAAVDPANPRTVIAVHAPQAAGAADRLTLTRAALARAGAILLLITGDDKKAKLEAALAGEETPVRTLFAPDMPKLEVLWSA